MARQLNLTKNFEGLDLHKFVTQKTKLILGFLLKDRHKFAEDTFPRLNQVLEKNMCFKTFQGRVINPMVVNDSAEFNVE